MFTESVTNLHSSHLQIPPPNPPPNPRLRRQILHQKIRQNHLFRHS
jgi:hypothetical protein